MRIQHNIMAMNAYRNYNNNTSALSKNLEKLSSGYKINRAGDDAAGLAISEKMRAQITGLDAAQKNVKDGISLVQTAEGAMQEVQDMLNRMVYLANQSANGTYDNDVDRANLQKEVNQLRDEINRIADSANFNGIKLLDGSLSAEGVASVESDFAIPDVGPTLGASTILHKDAGEAASKTTFSVDLHDLVFTAAATGDKLTIDIGGTSFTYEATKAGDVKASDIVAAFKAGKFKDADGSAVKATGATVGSGVFEVTGSGTRLTFTQKATDTATVNGDMTVSITAGKAAVTGNATLTGAPAAASAAAAGGTAATKAKLEIDLTGMTAGKAGGKFSVTLGDKTVEVTLASQASDYAALAIASKIAAALASTTAGASGSKVNFTVAANGDKLVIEATDVGTKGNIAITSKITAAANSAAGKGSVTGSWNKSTTVIENKGEAANGELASTKFELTKDMVQEGASIRIGSESYTFGDNGVKISDLDAEASDYLSQVAERLTKAAASNETYTVGHNGTGGTITVVENVAFKNKNKADYDLTTFEGVKKSLGYSTAAQKGTGGLTLQIGDTSDPYNQLNVSIGDIHCAALKIDAIDISTQKGAAAAVDVIKNAINTVSSIRGTLGATQNRLDHTANNLSVMKENITDAESSIRDTDIAEEMMSYTKNNILIQSAQAMLAQANQVPQGVLQLLQ